MSHHPHCPACGSPAPVDAEGRVLMHFDFTRDVWCTHRPDAAVPVAVLGVAWRRLRHGTRDNATRRSSYIPLS